jgi:5-deoxy-D-glucuronate isomerase
MARFATIFMLLVAVCFVTGAAAGPVGSSTKKITGKLTVQNNYGRAVSVFIEGKLKLQVPANSTLAIAVMENSSKTSIKIVATDGTTWEKRIGDENNPKMVVP